VDQFIIHSLQIYFISIFIYLTIFFLNALGHKEKYFKRFNSRFVKYQLIGVFIKLFFRRYSFLIAGGFEWVLGGPIVPTNFSIYLETKADFGGIQNGIRTH
jgi:hypothetical protein